MKKQIVKTSEAPQAIGTYSQAVKVDNTVYLSGQIALDPASGQLVVSDVRAQIERVFQNLAAVAMASGGSLADVVKLNVYLTDLGNFPAVNEIMARYFRAPYPARAAVGVAALPRAAAVEMDAVMVLAGPTRRKAQRRGAETQRRAKGRKKKR
jgi:reactive intermediate/imine deaminase